MANKFNFYRVELVTSYEGKLEPTENYKALPSFPSPTEVPFQTGEN